MTESDSKELLEVILHPVRMRIMMALAGSAGMSPLQMSEKLPDVPLATLYRHISRLYKAEVLLVAGERPARGTLEKVYTLNRAGTHLSQEAFVRASKADHLRYFTAFAMTLVDEFARYLDRTPTVDLAADGVGYHQGALFMSDAELVDFAQKLQQAALPYFSEEPPTDSRTGGPRKKRIFSTILVPDAGNAIRR